MSDARRTIAVWTPIWYACAFAGAATIGLAYAEVFHLNLGRILATAAAVAIAGPVGGGLACLAKARPRPPQDYARRGALAVGVSLAIIVTAGGLGMAWLGLIDKGSLPFYAIAVSAAVAISVASVYQRTLRLALQRQQRPGGPSDRA